MLIWSDNIELPQNIHDGINDIIEKNHTNKENYYTSFHEDSSDFSDILVPYYGKVIERMMKDLGIFKISRYQYNVWVQMYNSKTTTHPPHAHLSGGEIISFNHIINASKNKCFYFLNDDNNKTYPGEQKSGDIFAWPPWIIHGVDNVKEDNIDRLIVAGNISLRKYYNLDGSITTECVHDKDNKKFIWKYS